MKKIILTIVLATLCLFLKAQVQGQITDIKPLNIGDTIPEAIWNMPLQVVNHPQGKKTITLNDYKGKLIILDFWATWCSACIANMRSLHEVEKKFINKAVVLPVSFEGSNTISRFLKKNEALNDLKIFSITDDQKLNNLFPHRVLPHYVWIDLQGKIIAFTDVTDINIGSVKKALDGTALLYKQKQDIDTTQPLFLDTALPKNQLSYYSILIKGDYSGLPSGIDYRMKGDTVFGVYIANSPLAYIYQIASKQLLPDNFIKRLVIEPQAQDLFGDVSNASWQNDNFYSYELRVPLKQSKNLYQIMLDQMNQISGYKGEIQKRSIKCLVLSKTGNSAQLLPHGAAKVNRIDQKGVLHLNNVPMLALTARLNNALPNLVIDETGIVHSIGLNIKIHPDDFNSIRESLKPYGLLLAETIRKTEVLVLSKSL